MPEDKCSFFNDTEESYEYLIEYRGNFIEEISKLDYACGYKINNKYAVLLVIGDRVEDVIRDVPSVLFVNYRSICVLNSTSVSELSNIDIVKKNPYLDLDGNGVIIGIMDTGIDYMNKEFLKEDDTTRVEVIWDQTIESSNDTQNQNANPITYNNVFVGTIYSEDQINEAVKSGLSGNDPYKIVPSKDEIGHGTEIASLAGARGYNKTLEGVANGCTYAIVKLRQSKSYLDRLKKNNIVNVPVYDYSMIVPAIEYLKEFALYKKKPIVIINAVGSTVHPHNGSSLLSRYIDEISLIRGLVFVSGCGNEGLAGGHARGFVSNSGGTDRKDLNIAREMENFSFRIWITRPNKMALSIISPSGQDSGFIEPKINQQQSINFVYENTSVLVKFLVPDSITGEEIIIITFKNIKPGIWKFTLRGQYIVDGRYDIWLPPEKTLPPDTSFLEPTQDQTITTSGSARRAVSVGYYNQENNSIVGESGRGFPLYGIIKPDIAAPGINITAASNNGRIVSTKGSSVAAAITGGVCALLIEWGLIKGNDIEMFSSKIISLLTIGADRKSNLQYPDKSLGFGTLNLEGVFKSISGVSLNRNIKENYIEFDIKSIYVRVPKEMEVYHVYKKIQ